MSGATSGSFLGSVISRNGYQLKGQQSRIGNQINDGAILKVEC